MKYFLVLFICLYAAIVQAQPSDSQLAYSYYQRKEYDKAAEMFLKLYERTRSSNYLDYHIICLINGKKYEQAEEVLKKYLKKNENNKDFLINLGYTYEQQGKSKKAEECYAKAIKKLIPQNSDINNLAYKFRNIREYGWAIKTYLQGREILKKPDAFMLELGDNYMMERNYERMMDIFIRQLEIKPGDLNSVTSKLSFSRSYDMINNVDAVIEKKLAALFTQPSYRPVFDELAVWYALQKKDYPQAFRHAVLLNQKEENKLHIFLNIARDAENARNYETAEQAYAKIIEKGSENNKYYRTARKESLKCRYQKYMQQQAAPDLYRQLSGEAEKYLAEYGYISEHTDLAMLLADIYAYRLDRPLLADSILNRTTRIPRLTPSLLNTLKTKRADLLTFMDNPWEATILYTQIEKSNPNNDIGYEAKLKKAWLAYYAGDLLWAKAQFDVLKGATSKLISNDAIQMAHFIQLNYEEEGDNQELEQLAKAEYLIYKQQYSQALASLDSLTESTTEGVADRATLKKADLLTATSRNDQACQLLEKLKNKTGQTYIQAEAIYKLAALKIRMKENQAAKELYKQLVSEYSGSVYSIEAGKHYREIEKNENR